MKKKSHYNGIIDSDFEMIKEKWLPGAEIGGGILNFYIFLFSANPSTRSAQCLRTIHKL